MRGGIGRWATLQQVLIATLATATLTAAVRADEPIDEPRVVWVGERTPWIELLRAELALIGVSVEPGHAPIPVDESEALTRIVEGDAMGLVVSDEPVQLWMTDCEGALRGSQVATLPSPGRATVLMAELIWARLSACAEQAAPEPVETESAEPRPIAAPLSAPPPRLETVVPDPSPWALEAELVATRDGAGLFGPVGVGIGARYALHPHVALGLRATIAPRRVPSAPVESTWSGTLDLGLRVPVPLRRWSLALEGGPSLVWTRMRFQPNLGVAPTSQVFVGYHLGAGLEAPLSDRLRLGLGARLTHTGRRHELETGPRERGRWGPMLQTRLGLTLAL